ncbi:MAG: DUF4124 domain-containing protein [Pseudomonadales bacterium]
MKYLISALLLLGFAANASAADIVRWVDENGVTHFTEKYLAQAPATTVAVHKTNGMDVPDASSVPSSTGGAQFRKISKSPKKNKDGWRGYQKQNRYNRKRYRP